MTSFVIDASIAIERIIAEEGTDRALALLTSGRLSAPDLLTAECANILWKKVRRSELTEEEAVLAARILQHAEIELHPMRALLEPATPLALALDQPAYNCVYLALAIEQDRQFVTADTHFIGKVRQSNPKLCQAMLSLEDARAAS